MRSRLCQNATAYGCEATNPVALLWAKAGPLEKWVSGRLHRITSELPAASAAVGYLRRRLSGGPATPPVPPPAEPETDMSLPASNPLQQNWQQTAPDQQDPHRPELPPVGQPHDHAAPPASSAPGTTPMPLDDIPPFGESQEHLLPGQSPLPPVGDDDDQIRISAYEKYVSGGYAEGRDLENWLDAEREWRNRLF